ncbi:MAG: M15 family metallopeptidase [Defluviitaleaceae bacterium]|nr:M15 family metallopeptidase [Defluviitaleaceae bacterium]
MNQNKNRKPSPPQQRVLPKVITVIMFSLAVYFIWDLIANANPEILMTAAGISSRDPVRQRPAADPVPIQATDGLQTGSPPEIEEPMYFRQISLSEITPTPYLKLVNRAISIQSPINADYLVNVWPGSPARDLNVMLHATASAAIRDLLTEARSAGFSGLYVADGYRTYNEQSRLFANIADKTYVMPAGHSEHQLGLAADILSVDGNSNGMRGTAEAQWLAENAPRFGLILRYPYDKQDITEVAYEPWHFRYVGRVHAFIMGEYGFVLEEYIEFLRERETYETEIDGKTYLIMYQRPENGKISVLEHWVHTVSDANTGGYIITAWR